MRSGAQPKKQAPRKRRLSTVNRGGSVFAAYSRLAGVRLDLGADIRNGSGNGVPGTAAIGAASWAGFIGTLGGGRAPMGVLRGCRYRCRIRHGLILLLRCCSLAV